MSLLPAAFVAEFAFIYGVPDRLVVTYATPREAQEKLAEKWAPISSAVHAGNRAKRCDDEVVATGSADAGNNLSLAS